MVFKSGDTPHICARVKHVGGQKFGKRQPSQFAASIYLPTMGAGARWSLDNVFLAHPELESDAGQLRDGDGRGVGIFLVL